MTTRRSGGRYQTRGVRRTTDWGVGPQEASNTAIITSSTILWSGGTSPAGNFTLVRTRGWVNYYLLAVSAQFDGFQIASGIYMMTEDAFNVGVTACLDPIDDANSDMWIWHSFADLRGVDATFANGVNASAVVVRQEIDSKAMRKEFDPERRMVGVTQVIERGTSSMIVFADTRQLFKM